MREIGDHRIESGHGKLVPGTWKQIFHLECDVRGRERTIVVHPSAKFFRPVLRD